MDAAANAVTSLASAQGLPKYAVGNYLVIFHIVEEESVVRVIHMFHALQNYIELQKSEI